MLMDAYMKVINSWDMLTAHRLVEEAARAAGYSVKAYHGTAATDFNVFERSKVGNFGPGIYVSPDRVSAEDYASRYGGTRVVEVWVRYVNPIVGKDATEAAAKLFTMFPADSDAQTIQLARAAGYDAVVAEGTLKTMWGDSLPQVMLFDPSQIKITAPITYDDAGNTIPLSARFQKDCDDMRY